MWEAFILPTLISFIGSWLTVGAFFLFYRKIQTHPKISEKTRLINEITKLNIKIDRLNEKIDKQNAKIKI